jgi:hypothetical protein
VLLDHSNNKVLPASKLEALAGYFSKAAMSILGCQIFWTGKIIKNGQDIDGMFVWFVHFVKILMVCLFGMLILQWRIPPRKKLGSHAMHSKTH